VNRAGNILGPLLKGYDLDSLNRCGALVSRWEEVVGETIALHARPEGLRDGILTLVVESAAWAQQLHFLEDRIRDRITTAGFTVRAIRLRTGTLSPKARDAGPPTSRPLSETEAREIEDWCSCVENPELRHELRRLLITGLTIQR